jgi:hypothetical protein
VLLGDAGVAPLPPISEFRQVGEHDLAHDRGHWQIGYEPVQDRLRGRLVEGVEGLPQGPGQLSRGCGSRPGTAARPGAASSCSQRIAPEQPYQRRPRGVPTAMQPPGTGIILKLSSSS